MTTNTHELPSLPEIRQIRQLAELTNQEMAGILGVSAKELSKGSDQALPLQLTEKLLQIKNVFEQGLRVFANNPVYLNCWLKMPNQYLARIDNDLPAPDTNYEAPADEDLFVDQMPDLWTAALQNQEKLKEFYKQHPFLAKEYPTPLSLLDNTTGIQLVSQLLGQIEYGIYV